MGAGEVTLRSTDILLNLEQLPRPIDWGALFGDDRPVELEIGFGKGRAMLRTAALHPERGYLGVELARRYLLIAARRAARRGLVNVRLIGADAGMFLREYVRPGSLIAVKSYCPDPWPKKRHHKRRLFTFGFVDCIARALRPSGRFVFATDHAGYFSEVEAYVTLCPLLEAPRITLRLPKDGIDMARTNYERKWLSLGRPVYSLIAQRISGSTTASPGDYP